MNACQICSNEKQNRFHYPREMMLGLGDEFEYLECGSCGCLQITRVPADLARYYAEGYYSFEPPKLRSYPNWLLKLRAARTRSRLGNPTPLGWLGAAFSREQEHFDWLRRGKVSLSDAILDIGCGAGKHLLKLEREGFHNLMGVDPFIPQDIRYNNGVTVLKKQLSELDRQFDFVMFNHSFEHMPKPLEILHDVRRILNKTGHLMLRVPVADSYAHRKYGIYWAAWDAPRHLFLHTVRSIAILAEQAGFTLYDIAYDSTRRQFVTSELYQRNVPPQERSLCYPGQSKALFTQNQWKELQEFAEQLNSRRDGDTACFFLRLAN